MTHKYTDAEKSKVIDEILESFTAEDRRHERRIKMIRYQEYAMRVLIIGIGLLFAFLPLILTLKL